MEIRDIQEIPRIKAQICGERSMTVMSLYMKLYEYLVSKSSTLNTGHLEPFPALSMSLGPSLLV